MTDDTGTKVKYFTADGEEIVSLDPDTADPIPVQTSMFQAANPWPSVVFVLGSLVIFFGFILGMVWILHG